MQNKSFEEFLREQLAVGIEKLELPEIFTQTGIIKSNKNETWVDFKALNQYEESHANAGFGGSEKPLGYISSVDGCLRFERRTSWDSDAIDGYIKDELLLWIQRDLKRIDGKKFIVKTIHLDEKYYEYFNPPNAINEGRSYTFESDERGQIGKTVHYSTGDCLRGESYTNLWLSQKCDGEEYELILKGNPGDTDENIYSGKAKATFRKKDDTFILEHIEDARGITDLMRVFAGDIVSAKRESVNHGALELAKAAVLAERREKFFGELNKTGRTLIKV